MNELLKQLSIDKDLIMALNTEDEKTEKIFEMFIDKVYYDTTKNSINNKLYYGPENALEVLRAGYGLHCQEENFLLKDIYNFFGISNVLYHGDVYDFDTKIKKDVFMSVIVIDREEYFYHIDILHKIIMKVPKGEVAKKDNIVIEDLYKGYYLVKKYDGEELYYMERIFNNLPEGYRKERIQKTYSNNSVTPFGVITPFYWKSNPERKIFYDAVQDKVKVNIGRKTAFLDLLYWDTAEESEWISKKQKENIKQCINKIGDNIDSYLDMIQNVNEKSIEFRLSKQDIENIKSGNYL